MELSLNDLQHVRRTLKRTPPPKAPLSPSSGQNDAAPSNTSPSSVALFRNKFEQKPTPRSKGHIGSSPCQHGGQPSEEKVISVASAKAKFEQQSFVKSAPTCKQSTGNRSKAGSSILDKSSNACKGEPPRKALPAYFRIGTAPGKPAKPDHLKFRLRKFQDKIMLANGVTTAAISSKEEEEEFEENEDTYDDVASVIGRGNQGVEFDGNQEIYDDVTSVDQNGNQDAASEEFYECVGQGGNG